MSWRTWPVDGKSLADNKAHPARSHPTPRCRLPERIANVGTSRLLCGADAFKDHAKPNFFKGAALTDARGLSSASLDAKTARAIDFREGNNSDASALKRLIRATAAHSQSARAKG